MELLSRPSHFLAVEPNLHKLYFPPPVTGVSCPVQTSLASKDSEPQPLEEATDSTSSDEPEPLLSLSSKEQQALFDDFDLSFLTDAPSEEDDAIVCKEETQIVSAPSNVFSTDDFSKGTNPQKATPTSCCQGQSMKSGTMVRSSSWEDRFCTAQEMLSTAVQYGYRNPVGTNNSKKMIFPSLPKQPVKEESVPIELKFQAKIRRRRDIDWKVRKDRKAFQKVLRNRQAAQRSNEKRRRLRRQYQREMENLYDERQKLETRKEELIRVNQELREKVIAKFSAP